MTSALSILKWAAALFVAAGAVIVVLFVLMMCVAMWALNACVYLTPPW